jgi:hypothetical protein
MPVLDGQVHNEDLAREVRAVLTSDIEMSLRHVPQPHTVAQVLEAVEASVASFGSASFKVRVQRDTERPNRFAVMVVVLADP